MSASKRIALAVGISWLSRAATILAKLFLLPILFRYLGKEELGFWFLLGDSQGFLTLLGLGVAPTLMRHIALAKGQSGADPSVELTEDTQKHIADLVVTGQVILRWLAVIIFFIAWGVGYFFIRRIDLATLNPQIVFWSWTLMCVGYAVGVWVSYLECWLIGIGYVGWNNLISTIVNILTIITSILAVIFGGGLLALAGISVFFGLILRFSLLGFIRWNKPEFYKTKGRWNKDYFQAMIKPALYAWLTELGAYLIMRTDGYFIATFKGASDLPAYSAAYQLVLNIFVLANSFAIASPVFISQSWQAGDLNSIHRITLRNARLGLSVMAAGVAFLMSSGRELIGLWLGKENFTGYAVLGIFCIMLTLELQHNILALSARATEDEKYVPWALTAGFLNIIFTWALVSRLGLLGVALGTMLAQLVTNNWYQVYRPMVRLQLDFTVYFRQVIPLWATVLVCSLGFSWLAKQLLSFLGITSNWSQLILTAAICSVVWTIAFWQAILESSHKKHIQAKVKALFASHA
jgi:O-antigen/teichoic acid export membrane protein